MLIYFMKAKYINLGFALFITVIILTCLIVAYNYYYTVTEGLTNELNEDAPSNDLSKAFCNIYSTDASKLNPACEKLTSNTCKNIGCCVLVNGNKCVAGGQNGPTYKTGTPFDYFYYMKKCYGSNCPK